MSSKNQTTHRHSIVVVGAGTAGIPVAAALLRKRPDLDVAIIEPDEHHDYQPGWTLVGGGDMPAESTRSSTAKHLPKGAKWIRDAVSGFTPDSNQLSLASGGTVGYDYLVVTAGLQLDWDGIDGLTDTLGRNGVTSNYRYDLAPYTDQLARDFRGGHAMFTQPPMPIKCAGAPQKALYLSADTFRRNGVAAKVSFFNQGGAMFGVPAYAKALDKVMASYNAEPRFKHNLVGVDGKQQTATFATDQGEVTEHFDMLHVTPPQSAPDFIKSSPLAGEAGWVSVDKNNLRHTRYANVWALGDCTDTPNAKTMAAVRRQFPVVVAGLLAELGGASTDQRYDGYGACPLTVEHGKVLMAEFRYGGEVTSSFPVDPRVPRRSYWAMKRYFFPWLYWHVMLKGRDWHWPEPKLQPALTAQQG
jgi:sulfide:quinone oxidoreductase